MGTETKRRATVLTVVMVGLVANPILCFADGVNYAKQAAMADEALGQLGAHYLKDTSGTV
jgi:hypothetical protein